MVIWGHVVLEGSLYWLFQRLEKGKALKATVYMLFQRREQNQEESESTNGLD